MLDGFRVSVGTRTIEVNIWHLKEAASLVKLLALAAGHRLYLEVSGHIATGRKDRSVVELPALSYALETHAFVSRLW